MANFISVVVAVVNKLNSWFNSVLHVTDEVSATSFEMHGFSLLRLTVRNYIVRQLSEETQRGCDETRTWRDEDVTRRGGCDVTKEDVTRRGGCETGRMWRDEDVTRRGGCDETKEDETRTWRDEEDVMKQEGCNDETSAQWSTTAR